MDIIRLFVLLFIINTFGFAQVKFSAISFNEAKTLAETENKKILIDFYTDWCVPCKELDKHIFEDSTIGTFINEYYISLNINAETDYGRKIGKELNLQEAYPTIMLLTSDGMEIDRIIGLFDKEEYFQRIKDYTENKNTFDELLQKEKVNNNDLTLKEQIAKKYFERGDFGKAIEYYKYLIQSEQFNSDGIIYFTIGRLYSFINNIEKAKEYTEMAISKNPSQKNYKELLEKLNSIKRYNQRFSIGVLRTS